MKGFADFRRTLYSIDYQQWNHSIRNDGLLVSSITLSLKLGIAGGLGLAVRWRLLTSIHCTSMKRRVTQSTCSLTEVGFASIAPMFVCISFYNLDSTHPEIVQELNMRSLLDVDSVALGRQEA